MCGVEFTAVDERVYVFGRGSERSGSARVMPTNRTVSSIDDIITRGVF
jgi:hypothetical protein